jgi:AAA domain
MKLSDLRPASQYALDGRYNCLIYGAPGAGKTPLLATAPRPVFCAVERGMLSLRGSEVPTWEARTPSTLHEFADWAAGSSEAKNFDTFCIDSISEVALIMLDNAPKNNSDLRAAYGFMSDQTMKFFSKILDIKEKNIVFSAKQVVDEEGEAVRKKPSFPGQLLKTAIPHEVDCILHLGLATIPGVRDQVKALRSRESSHVMARDRSGRLQDFEPPNLTELFIKLRA